MTDVFTKEKRSSIMRSVRSSNNRSTELKLIKYFKQYSIKGWRRSYPIKGNPDFVFLKQRLAVFVDGCFWHGHDCRNTKPKTNFDYWKNKISNNKKRDEEVNNYLINRKWVVVRIWECELKKDRVETIIHKINTFIQLA